MGDLVLTEKMQDWGLNSLYPMQAMFSLYLTYYPIIAVVVLV